MQTLSQSCALLRKNAVFLCENENTIYNDWQEHLPNGTEQYSTEQYGTEQYGTEQNGT